MWILQANRPRSDKDYCAAVAPFLFGGYVHEDAPLERNDAENKWRITAAIVSGHRFMPFTKYPHSFPVMNPYSPKGLPDELGRQFKQHTRKDMGGGFKILVDENDKSRLKFQFVVPIPSA